MAIRYTVHTDKHLLKESNILINRYYELQIHLNTANIGKTSNYTEYSIMPTFKKVRIVKALGTRIWNI
jgi:hypothetical protein